MRSGLIPRARAGIARAVPINVCNEPVCKISESMKTYIKYVL